MVNKINYIHSSVFFIFSIFISAFDYFRSNNFIYFCFFLILVLGISHGSLDHIKGKKLLKIYKIENVSFFYLSSSSRSSVTFFDKKSQFDNIFQ